MVTDQPLYHPNPECGFDRIEYSRRSSDIFCGYSDFHNPYAGWDDIHITPINLDVAVSYQFTSLSARGNIATEGSLQS